MKRYAIIPTGNRPKEYLSVIESCKLAGVETITIATSKKAIAYSDGLCLYDDGLNISKWWNMGLEEIAGKENGDYLVAILNDDAILPSNWFDKMEKSISLGVSGASSPRSARGNKIAGYAFALSGKDNIRADENAVWWYTDDIIQRRCEMTNGFSLVYGLQVGNTYGNSSVERFQKQIDKDRLYYNEFYGG